MPLKVLIGVNLGQLAQASCPLIVTHLRRWSSLSLVSYSAVCKDISYYVDIKGDNFNGCIKVVLSVRLKGAQYSGC